MIKTGPLSPNELANQAYLAFSYAHLAMERDLPPEWQDITQGVRDGWSQACEEFIELGTAGELEGRAWDELGSMLHERLAQYDAWRGDDSHYFDIDYADRAALQIVARHLVNCHQAEPDEELDLDALAADVADLALPTLVGLGGEPVAA